MASKAKATGCTGNNQLSVKKAATATRADSIIDHNVRNSTVIYRRMMMFKI